jgi:hypothetical protein
MPSKICRVTNDGTGDVRGDGLPWPISRYIYADPVGDPNDAWLWDGPLPNPPPPDPLPPPEDGQG